MIPIPEPREAAASTAGQAHHMPRLLAGRPRPSSPSASGEDVALEPRRVLASLKYHWFVFLVLGSLSGGGLGAAAWELLPAKYTTAALLRVNSSTTGLLGSDPQAARNEFLTFLRTQADAIRSENVLRAALRDSKISGTSTLHTVEDPVRYLQENLLVEYSEYSEFLKVSMTGEDAAELADIINAVNAAYMKEVVAKDQLKKTALLESIDAGRRKLAEKINNQKLQSELKRRKPAGEPAPAPVAPQAAAQPAGLQITAAEYARRQEDHDRAEFNFRLAEQRLQQLEERRSRLVVVPPSAQELDEHLKRDAEYRDLSDRAERAANHSGFIRGAYMRTDHPDVLHAQRKADSARAAVEDYRRARGEELARQAQVQSRRAFDTEVAKERSELAQRDLYRKMLKQRLDTTPLPKEPEKLASAPAPAPLPAPREKDPTAYDLEISDLASTIEIYERLLELHNKGSVEVQAARPRVDEWQKASVPIQKEMKKQIIFTAFAVLVGFAAVGACVTLHEGRINRLFSVRDLEVDPALNVVGVLPDVDAAGDAQRLGADPYTEGVEKVRLMLGRSFPGKRAQAILVTSAAAGEGKSTLAAHLAVSAARADRKTVLVDADLRRPALHEHLGLAAGPGVCDWLRGEGVSPELAQRAGIHNLWFLPAGAWDPAAQHGLGRDRFRRILDRLRQEFDCIIIDSHDLSTVADTYQIGQYCDAVLVCARKYVSRRPAVEQAYHRVCDLGVPHTGLIFVGGSNRT